MLQCQINCYRHDNGGLYILGSSQPFVGLFCLCCCFGVHLSHEMDVGEVREMVNEDGGANVTLRGRNTAMSWNKTKGRANELIHADYLAWSSSLANLFSVESALISPWSMMCLAICTSSAGGRI